MLGAINELAHTHTRASQQAGANAVAQKLRSAGEWIACDKFRRLICFDDRLLADNVNCYTRGTYYLLRSTVSLPRST